MKTSSILADSQRAANPFCTRFVRPGAIAYQFEWDDDADAADQKISRLADAVVDSPLAAIIGPHGTGKSTLLHCLRPHLDFRFRQLSHIQLSSPPTTNRWEDFRRRCQNASLVRRAQRELHRTPADNSSSPTLLIVDGFEQLSFIDQRCVVWSASRYRQALLVTTHAPVPSCSAIYRTQPQALLIRQLTENLVDQAPDSIRQLVGKHLDRHDLTEVINVRDFWFDLYDVVADDNSANHR